MFDKPTLIVINLVIPKAGAKHELLFNKSEAILLNSTSCLAPALGVIKFMIVKEMIFGHTLLCYISPTKIFNKPTSDSEVSLLNSEV